MKNIEINKNHPEAEQAGQFIAGWSAGEQWVECLKVGDTFYGSNGEAKIRYAAANEYAISAFTSAGYRSLNKLKGLRVNDKGVIIKIER